MPPLLLLLFTVLTSSVALECPHGDDLTDTYLCDHAAYCKRTYTLDGKKQYTGCDETEKCEKAGCTITHESDKIICCSENATIPLPPTSVQCPSPHGLPGTYQCPQNVTLCARSYYPNGTDHFRGCDFHPKWCEKIGCSIRTLYNDDYVLCCSANATIPMPPSSLFAQLSTTTSPMEQTTQESTMMASETTDSSTLTSPQATTTTSSTSTTSTATTTTSTVQPSTTTTTTTIPMTSTSTATSTATATTPVTTSTIFTTTVTSTVPTSTTPSHTTTTTVRATRTIATTTNIPESTTPTTSTSVTTDVQDETPSEGHGGSSDSVMMTTSTNTTIEGGEGSGGSSGSSGAATLFLAAASVVMAISIN